MSDSRPTPRSLSRRFILEVVSDSGPEAQANGAAVLLSARIAVTVRHVVKGLLRVYVRSAGSGLVHRATVHTWLTKRQVDSDLALLTLTDPMDSPIGFPRLVRDLLPTFHNGLSTYLSGRTDILYTVHPTGADMSNQLLNITRHPEGVVLVHTISNGGTPGWSGSPVLLLPSEDDTNAIMLGVLAQGTNSPQAMGSAIGHAIASDSILLLAAELRKHDPSLEQLLDPAELDVIPASSLVDYLRKLEHPPRLAVYLHRAARSFLTVSLATGTSSPCTAAQRHLTTSVPEPTHAVAGILEGSPCPPGTTRPRDMPRNIHLRDVSFCIDDTETTVAQYLECQESGRCQSPPTEPTRGDGTCNVSDELAIDHPMNCIDFASAFEFCLQRGGRLPTEEEWMWVARGGSSQHKYPWSNTPPTCSHTQARVGDACENLTGTAPVASHELGDTPDGISDLSGNVWEWTSTESSPGRRRAKGGAWETRGAKYLETSHRYVFDEKVELTTLGFRCLIPIRRALPFMLDPRVLSSLFVRPTVEALHRLASSLLLMIFIVLFPSMARSAPSDTYPGLRSSFAWIMLADPSVPGVLGDMDAVRRALPLFGMSEDSLVYVTPSRAEHHLHPRYATLLQRPFSNVISTTDPAQIPHLLDDPKDGAAESSLVSILRRALLTKGSPPEVFIIHLSTHGDDEGRFQWYDKTLRADHIEELLIQVLKSYDNPQIILFIDTCFAEVAKEELHLSKYPTVHAIFASAVDEISRVERFDGNLVANPTSPWPDWDQHASKLTSHVNTIFDDRRTYSIASRNFIVGLLGAAARHGEDTTHDTLCDFMAHSSTTANGGTVCASPPGSPSPILARGNPTISISFTAGARDLNDGSLDPMEIMDAMEIEIDEYADRVELPGVNVCRPQECPDPWMACSIHRSPTPPRSATSKRTEMWTARCERGPKKLFPVSQASSETLSETRFSFAKSVVPDVFENKTTRSIKAKLRNHFYQLPSFVRVSPAEPHEHMVLLDTSSSIQDADPRFEGREVFFDEILSPAIAGEVVSRLAIVPFHDGAVAETRSCYDLQDHRTAGDELVYAVTKARRCFMAEVGMHRGQRLPTDFIALANDLTATFAKRTPSSGKKNGNMLEEPISLFILTDGVQNVVKKKCRHTVTCTDEGSSASPEVAPDARVCRAREQWPTREDRCFQRELRRASRELSARARLDPYALIFRSSRRRGATEAIISLFSFSRDPRLRIVEVEVEASADPIERLEAIDAAISYPARMLNFEAPLSNGSAEICTSPNCTSDYRRELFLRLSTVSTKVEARWPAEISRFISPIEVSLTLTGSWDTTLSAKAYEPITVPPNGTTTHPSGVVMSRTDTEKGVELELLSNTLESTWMMALSYDAKGPI